MDWEFDLLYALQGLHSPGMNIAMKAVTALGNGGLFWIALAAVFIIFVRKYRAMGMQMGAAMLLSFILGNLIIKNLVNRDRPCWIDTEVALLIRDPWDSSFPSGHTLNAFSAATAMFINDRRLGIPALLLAALIGFSRLYLFVHFPTDVLFGMVLGIADALIVCFLWKKL